MPNKWSASVVVIGSLYHLSDNERKQYSTSIVWKEYRFDYSFTLGISNDQV